METDEDGNVRGRTDLTKYQQEKMEDEENERVASVYEFLEGKRKKAIDKAAQKKFEQSIQKFVETMNEIIVKQHGKSSRKIITNEDLKHMGKRANQKMYSFMAYQRLGIDLKKKGMAKLTSSHPSYILMKLLDAVSENGLQALRDSELDVLKLAIKNTDFQYEKKSTLLEQISEEILERGSDDDSSEPKDEEYDKKIEDEYNKIYNDTTEK